MSLGAIFHRYDGTLERFTGDGIMVFFIDPLPQPDHALRAVRMALEMQREVGRLVEQWAARGHHLGLGIGIAHGPATLGRIGFEGALRLCLHRHDDQPGAAPVRRGARRPDPGQ